MTKVKDLSKLLTFVVASLYLALLCGYSCMLIGTLAHELMHKSYSDNPIAIQVNYDGSGAFYGSTFLHSHEWVYFNGFVVEGVLVLLVVAAYTIIINYRYDDLRIGVLKSDFLQQTSLKMKP